MGSELGAHDQRLQSVPSRSRARRPKKINGTRILSTQFLDDGTTAFKSYEYRLTAVNAKGKESHYVAVVVETHVISGQHDLRERSTE
jgi:hypothetical protein